MYVYTTVQVALLKERWRLATSTNFVELEVGGKAQVRPSTPQPHHLIKPSYIKLSLGSPSTLNPKPETLNLKPQMAADVGCSLLGSLGVASSFGLQSETEPVLGFRVLGIQGRALGDLGLGFRV